jgi:molybdate transport system ATP-binding protein
VLLLDEPLSGLDAAAREEVLTSIERLAASGVSLVMVSHDPGDLVPAIGHVLSLEAGRVAFCGGLAGYAAARGGNTCLVG